MKYVSLVSFALVLLLAVAGASGATERYTVTDLGTSYKAMYINDSGLIAGTTNNSVLPVSVSYL